MKLTVIRSPSEALALTNCLVLSKDDIVAQLGSARHVLVNKEFILTTMSHDALQRGQAAFSGTQRNWLQLALGDLVSVEPFAEGQSRVGCAQVVRLELNLLRKGAGGASAQSPSVVIDSDRMARALVAAFDGQVFSLAQPFVMDFAGQTVALKVLSLTAADEDGSGERQGGGGARPAAKWALLTTKTAVTFTKAEGAPITLTGANQVASNAIIQPDFSFEDLGIGGLDKEFWIIFRRAFASRIYPQDLVQKLGIRHVKGLVLYGPPGTGKTLMARQIAKMLQAREPKIVNGPEILNKYVGQSEENIRALFKDAEVEFKARGEDSKLHIIVFDELDAICKQRGAKNDGTGVGDSVVNQLLAKMDGVEQLNNILVIGMTNRLDMLDEALLRPGRFEVQLEIGLPSTEGRMQILKIHTNTMRQNNKLHESVNMAMLAERSKNFTGAEIVGLINSATSFALNRHIKAGTSVQVAKDASEMCVTNADFDAAFDEVHAAYGVSEDDFASCGHENVIAFSQAISTVLAQAALILKQLEASPKTALSTILLYGDTGCGKTSIAAKLAIESNFPFIKMLSTHSLVGQSEQAKINTISKVFTDAYKSQLSLVLVDDLEDLIEFVAMGPRFSSALLQTFRNYFKRTPPAGRRLVVIATCRNRHLIDQLGIAHHFRTQLYIPNVTTIDEVRAVMGQNQTLTPADRTDIFEYVNATLQMSGHRLSIPVKILIDILDVAAQDGENPTMRFVEDVAPFITVTPNAP